ncbi:hypothetical protein GW17_00039441 [Ensete ventricosum]|nr:hypothetical protein GW17_00039441 [Ensete ventricosum]
MVLVPTSTKISLFQVQEVEKQILDSKEKIEFYRNKMQELVSLLIIVLYKSRCDNRLNEITERASADRREVLNFTNMVNFWCL